MHKASLVIWWDFQKIVLEIKLTDRSGEFLQSLLYRQLVL
jgi:hypothetical protein